MSRVTSFTDVHPGKNIGKKDFIKLKKENIKSQKLRNVKNYIIDLPVNANARSISLLISSSISRAPFSPSYVKPHNIDRPRNT